MFSLWCVLCVRWYVCGIYELCADELVSNPDTATKITAVEDTPVRDDVSSPLLFQWSEHDPIVNDEFERFKDSLETVFDQSPDAIVQITGLYDPQEENSSGYEDLGLARAESIKDLLLKSGIKRSIRIESESQELSAGPNETLPTLYQIELVPQEEALDGFLITEMRGKVMIHFPTKNSAVNTDKQVLNALKKLAEDAAKNNRRLLVVGHTDNRGEAMDNMKLGLSRATNVKDLLISYGMKEKDVLAESEGESVPLVSNSTTRGRQQNRRVEIILI